MKTPAELGIEAVRKERFIADLIEEFKIFAIASLDSIPEHRGDGPLDYLEDALQAFRNSKED